LRYSPNSPPDEKATYPAVSSEEWRLERIRWVKGDNNMPHNWLSDATSCIINSGNAKPE